MPYEETMGRILDKGRQENKMGQLEKQSEEIIWYHKGTDEG